MALSRLQRICDAKFISVRDFENNPLRIFAAHELAAIIDPAMATKMTVQVQSCYSYSESLLVESTYSLGSTVLDRDRSNKPVMRTRTEVFLVLRTMVPKK